MLHTARQVESKLKAELKKSKGGGGGAPAGGLQWAQCDQCQKWRVVAVSVGAAMGAAASSSTGSSSPTKKGQKRKRVNSGNGVVGGGSGTFSCAIVGKACAEPEDTGEEVEESMTMAMTGGGGGILGSGGGAVLVMSLEKRAEKWRHQVHLIRCEELSDGEE